MKQSKKIFTLTVVVLALVAMSITAFAVTTNQTPAELVAELTNRTVDNVRAEKIDSGKTYGGVANQYNLLAEFRDGMLELKKSKIEERVTDGTITEEQADAILETMETCDGTRINEGIGKEFNLGFGGFSGNRDGSGSENGMGQGMKSGLGNSGSGYRQGGQGGNGNQGGNGR